MFKRIALIAAFVSGVLRNRSKRKGLICAQLQAKIPSNGRPLGECRMSNEN